MQKGELSLLQSYYCTPFLHSVYNVKQTYPVAKPRPSYHQLASQQPAIQLVLTQPTTEVCCGPQPVVSNGSEATTAAATV